MLRRARWFLLLALATLTIATGVIFLTQRKAQRRARPAASAPLPANISATADSWTWELKNGDLPKVLVEAKNFQQVKEPSTFLLDGVQIRIYSKDGETFNLVKSARASFDTASGLMYSDGQVDITTGLAGPGPPDPDSIHIRSSGVHLDAATTKVWTNREATFESGRGSGSAVGATYEPQARELLMNSEVRLLWRGGPQGERDLQIEAASLTYRELSKDIILAGPARLIRSAFTLDAARAYVFLNNGSIERVEAFEASGRDRPPDRKLDFSANRLVMLFDGKTVVRRVEAEENARLESVSTSGSTVVTSSRIDLDFDTSSSESRLTRGYGHSRSRVESTPAARPNGMLPPLRVLTSEVIELTMRPGGEEIQQVVTHSPATVDFIPRREGDKKRRLAGERMTVVYAPGNMIETVRAVNVVTTTETPKKDRKTSIATTRSRDFHAFFDTRTGATTRIEQWPDFEYEEGTSRGRAVKATLDSTTEVITLAGSARLWDQTGSTSADTIVLDQKSGDMAATGNVASTRLPSDGNQKGDSAAGMLDSSQPVQARAQRMTSSQDNTAIRYEGDVLIWQGGSRLRGRNVLIDRKASTVTATGDVLSLIPDDRSAQPRPGSPASTIRAASLVYDDKAKIANYTGGVSLERPNFEMKSAQLRAWFREEPPAKAGGARQSKLDRVFSDGDVKIRELGPEARKSGSSEHSEYYPGEERIELTGGNPVVNDSRRGVSRGAVITWFAREDRLIVDNTGSGPSVSRIRKQ